MNYKKLLAALLAVCLIALWSPTSIRAEEPAGNSCGDALTWELSEDGTLTISGEGDMYDYSETESPWYSAGCLVESVKVCEGVTGIGDSAFYGCEDLLTVALPDSLVRIGRMAFSECFNLVEISIPEGVTVLPFGTFSDCFSLQSVVLPDSLTQIEDYAFSGCFSLADMTLPRTVSYIGEYAFLNCDSLTCLELPAAVTLMAGAFSDCGSLVEITFSGSAPYVYGAGVFSGVTAEAYYPQGNSTWNTAAMGNHYGGTLVWIPYTPAPEPSVSLGDVNGDGVVNILDANLVAAYYNEVIDSFPAEKK